MAIIISHSKRKQMMATRKECIILELVSVQKMPSQEVGKLSFIDRIRTDNKGYYEDYL